MDALELGLALGEVKARIANMKESIKNRDAALAALTKRCEAAERVIAVVRTLTDINSTESSMDLHHELCRAMTAYDAATKETEGAR